MAVDAKNKMYKIFTYFLMLILMASCEMKECSKDIQLERGRISIPCDWSYQKKSPVEDFFIYSFADQKNVNVMALYVGSHPSAIIMDGQLIKATERKNSDYSFDEKVWSEGPDQFSGVVNVNFVSGSWPERLQFSYSNLKLAEKQQVDAIIDSLTFK